MDKIKSNFNVPDINGETISYKGKEYKLIRMSAKSVEQTGTPMSISEGGLLAIEGNKIWCYGIPEEYLSYTLINEIECSEVADGEGLCLLAVKDELKQVPYKIMDNYLLWRIAFFQNMENFYQAVQVDEFYAKEMKQCYDYLELELKRRLALGDISDMVGKLLS